MTVAKAQSEVQPRPHDDVAQDKDVAGQFIRSHVAVHDRTQIETVFDYAVAPARSNAKGGRRKLHYRVESFFFFPQQFGINSESYSKDRFYGDIRPLVRFREPRIGYKQIVGDKRPDQSPLVFLDSFLADLEKGTLKAPLQRAVDEVRVFACTYSSYFARAVERRNRDLKQLEEARERMSEDEARVELVRIFGHINKIMERAEEILRRYRSICERFSRIPSDVAAGLRREVNLVDEYCYYRMKDGVARLVDLAKPYRGDGAPEEVRRFERLLVDLVSEADAQAQRRGYYRIGPNDSDLVKERFVHRRGELKRRMWSVFFLDVRTKPLFTFQKQMGAMVAAGLAAAWAAVAQIIVISETLVRSGAGGLIGVGGFLFITAAVLAYIVKDRIKEIGRGYFSSGLFSRIPDTNEKIIHSAATDRPREVGQVKEWTRFLSDTDLPPEIEKAREEGNGDLLDRENAPENVIHYSKEIALTSDIVKIHRYPLRAIHDIMRINIDACLPRLGEASKPVSVLHEGGKAQKVVFPKVYYLHLILKHSKLGPGKQAESEFVDHLRLVLNKKGLLRVERIG